MVQVKIKVLPGGHMPKKQTDGAAAWDCYARIKAEGQYGNTTSGRISISIGAAGIKIPLGFAMELPDGYHAEIIPRSSMGTKSPLRISNSVGIIDSDYRGEVCMIFDNNNDYVAWLIRNGERIAQMIIVKDPEVELVEAEELSETERGAGGFGSTGER